MIDPTLHQDYANIEQQQTHWPDPDVEPDYDPITPPPDTRKINPLIFLARGAIAITFWLVFGNFLLSF